ncbi:hypothetical protein METBIDRAFT_26581, partial [Metschnikowia bicuspidata var. bicuspidata NRRL YB-4993]
IPDRVLLALSGGADSMCLAYLLAQYKKQSRLLMLISAITIDHGFRQESAAEAKKVGDIVLLWGIQHHVEKLRYLRDVHSITNFEEIARDLRYNVFRKKCADYGTNALLVAHNKDDQLETFLQRLQMNSTLFGLVGLRERSPLPTRDISPLKDEKVYIYRPLLHYKKAEIFQTCKSLGVPWFEDHSNQDIHLTKRNLLRYIINEYVPQALDARPELTCITRKSLTATTQEIESFVHGLEIQKLCFDLRVKSHQFQFDKVKAEVKFSIPFHEIMGVQQLVFSRWLYETIYPLSSSKNFHWSYAKLERQAIPRLWTWLQNPQNRLTMTYLNVKLDINPEGQDVNFLVSRQAPQRDVVHNYFVSVVPGDCMWHLFDRLWWLKFE